MRYPEDGNWEDAGVLSDRGSSEPSTPEKAKDMNLESLKSKVDDAVGKLFVNVGQYQQPNSCFLLW